MASKVLVQCYLDLWAWMEADYHDMSVFQRSLAQGTHIAKSGEEGP